MAGKGNITLIPTFSLEGEGESDLNIQGEKGEVKGGGHACFCV